MHKIGQWRLATFHCNELFTSWKRTYCQLSDRNATFVLQACRLCGVIVISRFSKESLKLCDIFYFAVPARSLNVFGAVCWSIDSAVFLADGNNFEFTCYQNLLPPSNELFTSWKTIYQLLSLPTAYVLGAVCLSIDSAVFLADGNNFEFTSPWSSLLNADVHVFQFLE